jgi:hypothetical protein
VKYRAVDFTVRSFVPVSMPATLILLPAVVIGVIAWLAAWWYARNSTATPRDEIQRLRNHAAWLEQRLDVARQERWDHAMIVGLSDQLGTTCDALARARHRSPDPTLTSAR